MEISGGYQRSDIESLINIKDLIVIDNGSDSIKLGISGEDQPRVSIFETVSLRKDFGGLCGRNS